MARPLGRQWLETRANNGGQVISQEQVSGKAMTSERDILILVHMGHLGKDG